MLQFIFNPGIICEFNNHVKDIRCLPSYLDDALAIRHNNPGRRHAAAEKPENLERQAAPHREYYASQTNHVSTVSLSTGAHGTIRLLTSGNTISPCNPWRASCEALGFPRLAESINPPRGCQGDDHRKEQQVADGKFHEDSG